jgi:hypothetical protein
MGRPDREKPHGTEIDGSPPRLNANVHAWSAKGSVASWIVSGSPDSVGSITMSTLENASCNAARCGSRF